MLPARKMNGHRLFPDFFNDFLETTVPEKMCTNAPAINVKENDHDYKIELAVPGMTKDDFKIHINKDGNLVVEMEKKKEEKCGTEEDKKKECKYLRQEFCYCKFHQTLALPDNVDRENIEAYVKNGVLKIKVPKLPVTKIEDEKRVIEVK